MFVGWDWASTTHDVTVVDDAGRVVDRWAAEHTETGLVQTLARLAGHGRPEQLPVAIERPSGLVVNRLLAAGHPGHPDPPQCLSRHPARLGSGRAKSDPGDSFKLADCLRTDGHRLRPLRPLDAATRQLQALARVRDDHVAAKAAASNQLGALLEAHWPGAKQVFSRLGSPDRPGVPGRLPDAGVGGSARRGPPGRLLPAALLPWWLQPGRAARAAPRRPHSPGWTRPSAHRAGRCPGPAAAHPAWHHRRPGPGAGRRAARHAKAELLAPCRASARSTSPRSWPRSARSWTAPATSSTPASAAPPPSPEPQAKQGRRLPAGSQHQSPAGPDHLCQQFPAQFAMGSQAICRRPPTRQAPPHAVRILARAWLRVIWACWHTNTVYDPAKHGAEKRLAA
jgi:Transposase